MALRLLRRLPLLPLLPLLLLELLLLFRDDDLLEPLLSLLAAAALGFSSRWGKTHASPLLHLFFLQSRHVGVCQNLQFLSLQPDLTCRIQGSASGIPEGLFPLGPFLPWEPLGVGERPRLSLEGEPLL